MTEAVEQQIKRKNVMQQFAFCGTNEFFSLKLEELSKLAEPEDWTSKRASNQGYKNDRLYNYIIKTFEYIKAKDLIIYSDDNNYCTYNTGLLTVLGEDIFGFFERNSNPPKTELNPQKWKFKGFLKASSRLITDNFSSKPKLIQYCENFSDFYFDTEKDIDINIEHIIEDHWTDEDGRFPSELKNLGKNVVVALINYAVKVATIRIKRNNRLVVPQYYNDEIMYLIPLDISMPNSSSITMALAVEKTDTGSYRANTIFDLDMAYTKARLVMKPESNWLIK